MITAPIKVKTEEELRLWICGDDQFTNCGFRIAYFIWTLKGSNLLEDLEYYSEHVDQYTDNFMNLRGAYGPRMMNWVGADQLQEALNINVDLESEEEYVKPNGVHQLEAVYNDLNLGMKASTIVIRDPSIDFDETNDVPDLLAVTFVIHDNILEANLFYELVEHESKVVNDFWTFSHIAEMLRSWLLLEKTEINIVASHIDENINNLIPVQYATDLELVDKLCSHEIDGNKHQNGSVIHPNPNNFWIDFEKLDDFEKHLRFRICGESFQNEAVSTTKLAEDLVRLKLNEIESKYIRELGYCLLIFAFAKYDWENLQEKIVEWLESVDNPGLRAEIVEHLSTFSEPVEPELKKIIVGC